jgi:hypothetical protein
MACLGDDAENAALTNPKSLRQGQEHILDNPIQEQK